MSDPVGVSAGGGDVIRRVQKYSSVVMSRLRASAVWLVIAALAACGCTSDSSESRVSKRRLSIATGGTGGVFYPYGGGIAKIISENIENVEATAEVTAASVDNLKFLKQGTSDLAFTMADTAQDAALGTDVFADFGAVPARTLAMLYSSYVHLVTDAGSGIEGVADLRGRTVSIGSPGSGTAILAGRILTAAGLNPQRDLRIQSLGVAQSADALKDGKVDAFFWNGGLPTAAIVELVNSPGIEPKFISTEDMLPLLQRAHGASLYYRALIPKATYSMAADVPVVAVANLLVVSETMPEALAYDITRLLFEKQDELAGIHPQARELSLTTAMTGSPLPFHPGAIRYYRERGVGTAAARENVGSGEASPKQPAR
jgi:TRAP transporter TAXI family solute receptor